MQRVARAYSLTPRVSLPSLPLFDANDARLGECFSGRIALRSMAIRFCDLLPGSFDRALQLRLEQIEPFPQGLRPCLIAGPPRRQGWAQLQRFKNHMPCVRSTALAVARQPYFYILLTNMQRKAGLWCCCASGINLSWAVLLSLMVSTKLTQHGRV